MIILVTGASGYVGSHLTRRLVNAGYSVRALVRAPKRIEEEGRLKGYMVDIVQGDVTQLEGLPKALEDVNAIIHLVANAIERKDRKYEDINYQGTVNIVEAATAAGIRRFVNMR